MKTIKRLFWPVLVAAIWLYTSVYFWLAFANGAI